MAAVGEDDVCVVCQDNLHNGDENHVLPECGHEFHTHCVMQWFRTRQSRCPLCANMGGTIMVSDSADGEFQMRTRRFKTTITEAIKFAKSATAPVWLKNIIVQMKTCKEKLKKARAAEKLLQLSTVPPGVTYKKAHHALSSARAASRVYFWRIRRHERHIEHRVRVVPITLIKRIRPRMPPQRQSARLAVAAAAVSAAPLRANSQL
jgi:Ring finger domain